MARSDHWTYKLFIENAAVYLPMLEAREGEADSQVEVLAQFFDRHNVPHGGRVLDTQCGIGRHSVRLAQRGYDVTGVELSPLYVRKARERADEDGLTARFLEGDVAKVESMLQGEPPFDAVINMFTSIGYYGRQTDLYLFRQLRRLVTKDSALVVLTQNRDWLVHSLTPELTNQVGEYRHVMRQRFDFETSTNYNDWEFFKGDNDLPTFTSHLEVRTYSLHELKALLAEAGWRYVEGFGSGGGREVELQKLSADHSNMWVVARAN